MFKMKTGVLAAALMFAVSASAQAAPLTGGFSKSGSLVPIDGGGEQLTTFTGARAIDFLELVASPDPTEGVPGEFLVNEAIGDFAFLLGSIGLIKDFTFTGAAVNGNYPVPPIAMFELVDGLEFDLLSVSVVFQNAGFLLLEGTGLFRLAGFDDTPGTFGFSSQTTGAGTFSFSASQAATAVPEPASLALLGMGFFAAAAAGRRRRVRA